MPMVLATAPMITRQAHILSLRHSAVTVMDMEIGLITSAPTGLAAATARNHNDEPIQNPSFAGAACLHGHSDFGAKASLTTAQAGVVAVIPLANHIAVWPQHGTDRVAGSTPADRLWMNAEG